MQPETIKQANIETYRFLKRRGITSQDIESHPRADDVVLLTAFKDTFHSKMNPKELATWAGYWNTVYYKKKPLKDKALVKFEQIINNIQQREQHQQQVLEKIKSLRDHLKA